MKVQINPLDIGQAGFEITGKSKNSDSESMGFGELLKAAIDEVNALQQQSSDLKAKLVAGEIEDIHQVMIAAEKSSLAFGLTLQIRNKIIEAYQEIMRMQV